MRPGEARLRSHSRVLSSKCNAELYGCEQIIVETFVIRPREQLSMRLHPSASE